MKKLISIVMALLTLAALVLPAAAGCIHSYIPQHFPASCLEPEHTVYTCGHCGDTYTKYAWEYNEPNGFALVFDTVRSDENSTLALTVTVLNNPGLLISHLTVGYDAAVLSPESYINGEVWDKEDYMGFSGGADLVNLENNPVKIYTEEGSTESNRKSGVYFTLIFNILDPDGDYGFSYYINPKNFVDFEGHFFNPQVIDVAGKRELSAHSYITEITPATCTQDGISRTVCTVCKAVKSEEILKSPGHIYGDNVVEEESTGTSKHGHLVKTCTGCGDRIETLLPFRGDADNDGKVNAVDANIIKQYVIGILVPDSELTLYAVDINRDKKINSVDANMIKLLVLGIG